jgi:hypothetical protein
MPTIDDLKPTVEDVSLLLRTRTVNGTAGLPSGLGGDTGPGQVTTFSDTTRPSASEVQAIIDQTFPAIGGRVPFVVPDAVPSQSIGGYKLAAAAYAAMVIEESFFRETVTPESIAFWTGIMDRELTAMQRTYEDQQKQRGYGFGTLRIGTSIAAVSPPDPTVLP